MQANGETSMARAGEVYQDLLSRIREEFPEVVEQVQDEAARGAPIRLSQLTRPERDERVERVKQWNARAKLAKGDLAVVPYDEEQKLDLLVDSLTTLAETMLSSRRAIAELAAAHGVESAVSFSAPDETDPDTTSIRLEPARVGVETDRALTLLSRARSRGQDFER
jgi:hypothetical protein